MKTTIDAAGRVVIPAAARAKAGLVAGAELDVVVDDFSVRLVRSGSAPRVTTRKGRRVARPTARKRPAVDIAALVEEERNRWPW